MTETVRNTWVNFFQCKQAANLVALNKSIGNGICAKKNVRKNNILSSLINVIASYNVFEDGVTYAYSFAIVLENDADNVDTTITIDGTDYTSSARDTVEAILSDLRNELNDDFEVLVLGNTIYVWSYDNAYDTNTTTTTDITTGNTITVTNLTDDPDVILDEINCLDSEEICTVIKYTKRYINTKCNC